MPIVKRDYAPFGARRTGAWGEFLLGGAIVICLALPVVAGFEGDIEMLKVTALAQKDNVQRIATWQGSSSVEQTIEDQEGIRIRESSTFRFVFSREHEATRWEWKGQNRYVREGLILGGVPAAPNWTLNWANEMRKGDAFYKYELARTTPEGERRGTLVISPAKQAEATVYSYSFDPMWYLNGQATVDIDDMARLLMSYYEKSMDPNYARDATVTVKRDADCVIFDIRHDDLLNHHVFDLSKGGSLVQYRGESDKCTELREWTYEQKDGVWVPKEFLLHSQWQPPRPSGMTKFTRKVTFTENTVNHPVAASEFSLEKLGLQIGDPVSDHRLGLYYLYRGGEELPSENPDVPGKATPAVAADSSSRHHGATPREKPAAPEPAPEDANSAHPGLQGTASPAWLSRRTSAAAVVVLALSLSAVLLLLLRRRARREVRS